MEHLTVAGKLRIDKWLWAARFFKTRSLAAAAVECGRVQVDGVRIKPACMLAVGDILSVRCGHFQYLLTVMALCARRGPASEAQQLYRETEASSLRRAALALELKAQAGATLRDGRPSRKERREIERFRKLNW